MVTRVQTGFRPSTQHTFQNSYSTEQISRVMCLDHMCAVLSVAMKKNLPYLNQERLNIIFKHVYDVTSKDEAENRLKEEKLSDLLKVLQAMQLFNYRHRPDDTRELYGLMSNVFSFEPNSEGTTYWLSLILAIRELPGLLLELTRDKEDVEVIYDPTSSVSA